MGRSVKPGKAGKIVPIAHGLRNEFYLSSDLA
jgi:hypothetical protein